MPQQPMGSPPPSPAGAAMPAPDMGMMPPDMGAMPPPEMGAMPPDMGMPPPDMGGMPPQGMPEPINMAEGGFVQSFRAGSDEEGVTPARPSPPVDPYSAQALLQQLDARRDPEALRSSYQELMPMYQEALGGGDRSASQAQMLFDIAQAGLNLAAGTDSQGRRVAPGASFASSLAAAAQGLPERIGARVGLMEQQEQGTRLAALKGAQEQTSAQRSLEEGVLSSYALADRKARDDRSLAASKASSAAQQGELDFTRSLQLAQNKADLDLRNAAAVAGLKPLGGGLKPEWQIIQELVGPWSMNQLDTGKENLMQTAITLATAPTEREIKDPITGASSFVTTTPAIPDYLAEAMKARGMDVPKRAEGSTTPSTSAGAPPAGAPRVSEKKTEFAGVATPLSDLNMYTMTGNSLFNLAEVGTGPLNVSKSWMADFPLLGEFVKAEKETDGQTYINGAINTIIRALGETERFGIIEKNQIKEQVQLLPKFLGVPDAFQRRVIGLDNLMLDAFNSLEETAFNPNLPVATRQEALAKQDQLRRARKFLGAPPRVYNEDQRNEMQPGSYYLWFGQQLIQRNQ